MLEPEGTPPDAHQQAREPTPLHEGLSSKDAQNALQEREMDMAIPMCWFLLIAIVSWLVLVLLATVIVLCITHNPLGVSIFAPLASPAYLLYQILKPLLPMNPSRFELAKMTREKFPQIMFSGKGKAKQYELTQAYPPDLRKEKHQNEQNT